MHPPLQKLEQLEQALEETLEHAIPPKGRWRTLARLIGWGLFVVYLLFAAAVLVLRYSVLPRVAEYRSDIEQYASKVLGQRITIGAIETGWRGLRPDLLLAEVTIYDHGGRAAVASQDDPLVLPLDAIDDFRQVGLDLREGQRLRHDYYSSHISATGTSRLVAAVSTTSQ